MKNKINGALLTLLMLFATLYPSGQAYANGLPPKVMTYVEKQNIAQSLINDENFKTVFTELYAISKRINLDQLKKSSFDIATLAKVQESNTQTDAIIADKSKLATLLGYNSVLEFEIVNTKIDKAFNALMTDHKELKNLKPNEIQEIFKINSTSPNYVIYGTSLLTLIVSLLAIDAAKRIVWFFCVISNMISIATGAVTIAELAGVINEQAIASITVHAATRMSLKRYGITVQRVDFVNICLSFANFFLSITGSKYTIFDVGKWLFNNKNNIMQGGVDLQNNNTTITDPPTVGSTTL